MARPPVPPASVLVDDYRSGLSLSRVAMRHRVGHVRIRAALAAAGVEARPCGGHRGGQQLGSVRKRLDLVLRVSFEAAESGPGVARRRSIESASNRLHALRAQVRVGGALLVGPLTIAAAHAAGLTLEDIHEVFAVPPAEAARAIAAHAGR